MAIQYQKSPMQIQSTIYIDFVIIVYLGSIYIIIYIYENIKYQLTQWISMFQDVIG